MVNITKLYAAYKAGYLGDNILDTYFSFIANIIIKNKIKVIEASDIANAFENEYNIKLPLTFITQILSVGIQKNCFIEDHGKYSVDIKKIQDSKFDNSNFEELWSQLISEFYAYCMTIDVLFQKEEVNDFILNIIDNTDDKILSNDKIEEGEGIDPKEFAWYSFVKKQAEEETDLYSFIASISASNITKQALFYIGEEKPDYSDLHVYLDSPIIFALLGIDDESRIESYHLLLSDMKRAKCNVHILDHNFQEVEGILNGAAGWATSTQYDIGKANKAARFFHDNQMNDSEISEFCGSVETKLNSLGITVKKTNYDVYENCFQEDETKLYEMVKEKYTEQGYNLPIEKEHGVKVDVRSIIMIYRERRGQTSTRIQTAKHLMLTSNNAIANVSKKYESNRSLNAGHIPACISADLFGSILWLHSPAELMQYNKKKLLADCYKFLSPNKKMLEKYIEILTAARNAEQINEKEFLFLRTHKVVLDSLMNITRGDYARFNSNTYLEVYDDIQARATKKYDDEAKEHNKTRQKLKEVEEESEKTNKEKEKQIKKLQDQVSELRAKSEKEKKERLEKKEKFLELAFKVLFAVCPFVVLSVIIEIVKSIIQTDSWVKWVYVGGIIIISLILTALYNKCKTWCSVLAKKCVERYTNNGEQPFTGTRTIS